jgi:hypothetical protein
MIINVGKTTKVLSFTHKDIIINFNYVLYNNNSILHFKSVESLGVLWTVNYVFIDSLTIYVFCRVKNVVFWLVYYVVFFQYR